MNERLESNWKRNTMIYNICRFINAGNIILLLQT